ncbi:MAG: hypothetical protein ACRDKJ_03895 [Actinomycetota bacterium]
MSAYLDEAIRGVAQKFTREGEVQWMLGTTAGESFSVIDREAIVGFGSKPIRAETYKRLREPLLSALGPKLEATLGNPREFGGKLDLLAIDKDGRLLVMEVKPATYGSGIVWSPLQVMFYAELFQEWATKADDATECLRAMLDQRVELGLTKYAHELKEPLEIIPVVAVGGEIPDKWKYGLKKVRDALREGGAPWSDRLRVSNVHPSVHFEDL